MIDAEVERLCLRLPSIGHDELRARAAARAMNVHEPVFLVLMLGKLLRLARDRRAAATCVTALSRALARGHVDAEKVERVRQAARSRADRLVQALCASGAPRREYDRQEEKFVDRRMNGLPLGQRRTLSRARDVDLLARLAHDQDPRVVRELLANPRVTEREALIAAARRPTRPAVLEEVLASRFGLSRRVRCALAHNPYASVALSVQALASLTVPDLRAVAADEHVLAEVRSHARALIVGRTVTAAERDRKAPPQTSASDGLAELLEHLEAGLVETGFLK